ncbi:hypothetical protein L9F63_022972, partial [Diploptera punctata]
MYLVSEILVLSLGQDQLIPLESLLKNRHCIKYVEQNVCQDPLFFTRNKDWYAFLINRVICRFCDGN